MSAKPSIIFILGPPGAGKTTLGTRLTKIFSVHHISVGNLLRHIKNNPTLPNAEILIPVLNKQELIDGKFLVPILMDEFEELETGEKERRVILVDGFPRNLEQLKTFEELFGNPILVLLFDCSKDIAKKRYLARKVEGREADDEAMFEKRYEQYERESRGIEDTYRERRIFEVVKTDEGTERAWEELCRILKMKGVFEGEGVDM